MLILQPRYRGHRGLTVLALVSPCGCRWPHDVNEYDLVDSSSFLDAIAFLGLYS